MKFWFPDGTELLDSKLINMIVDNYLLPETNLQISKKLISDQIENEIFIATENQIKIISRLRKNRFVFIDGVAGSGKTLIAMNEAKRFAEGTSKVLYLCYNKLLARTLYTLNRDTENLSIFNYHQFIYSILNHQKSEWYDDLFEPNQSSHLKALENYIEYYECIIIDEAQDFKYEWFENILFLLKESKNTRLWLFYDKYQDIYNGSGIGKFSKILNATNYELRINCRNTPEIGRYAYKNFKTHQDFLDIEYINTNGLKVTEEWFTDPLKQREYIKKEVNKLLKDGFALSDIVLLSAIKWENTSLFQIGGLGNTIPITDEFLTRQEREIFVSTVHSFKGLESKIVFVFDFRKQEYNESEILYTCATRAKTILYILTLDTSQEKLKFTEEKKDDFSF